MPKPKVNKVLAYRKCQRCRKDRQKCSPEGRSWPGRRCDRCQRYGYACSANRTKDEEIALSNSGDSTTHDAGSGTRQPFCSPGTPSIPEGDAESEARSLQELGDWRQVLTTARNLKFLHWIIHANLEDMVRNMINGCVQKIALQARTHQTQGRYKDAEYLYRQLEMASAPLNPSVDSLLRLEPDMVLIYEKLGNLPAAEVLQEHRLIFSMSPEQGSEDAIISREAENLFRLYILFLARIEDLFVFTSARPALLIVFYRIAILGCSLLNSLLFQSELWTRCNPELCLHIAIRIQSTEMIRGLISIGVDINKRDDVWSPPLLTAAQYGDLEGLELLLENNVDIRAKDFSGTALHYALSRDGTQRDGTYEIIRRLIRAGVDVNGFDSNSRTALFTAMYYPEPEEKVIRCLIEAGVDIEAADSIKDTALCHADRRQYLTTVRLLLQQGANTEVRGSMGESPLSYAVRSANGSMAELLLDHGANIEAKDRRNDTPLQHAVKYKHLEIAGMLLKKGASAAVHNDLFQTPVDIARDDGDQILVEMLLGHEI